MLFKTTDYLEGRCHIFAIALHQLTNKSMICLWDTEHYEGVPADEQEPIIRHIWVKGPGLRTGIDIRGVVQLQSILNEFECNSPKLTTFTVKDAITWARRGSLEIPVPGEFKSLVAHIQSHPSLYLLPTKR